MSNADLMYDNDSIKQNKVSWTYRNGTCRSSRKDNFVLKLNEKRDLPGNIYTPLKAKIPIQLVFSHSREYVID